MAYAAESTKRPACCVVLCLIVDAAESAKRRAAGESCFACSCSYSLRVAGAPRTWMLPPLSFVLGDGALLLCSGEQGPRSFLGGHQVCGPHVP